MRNVTSAASFLLGFLFLFVPGSQMAAAMDASNWIDETQAFKPRRVCKLSNFEIVLPPYSTENDIADGDACGKIYVFVDDDSDKRVGFAGALVFDRMIDTRKYSEMRRQLVAMIAAVGGDAPKLTFSRLSEEQTGGFAFETINMRSNGIDTPDGKMTWEVGLRRFGDQTVMLFSGLTDLALQQDALNEVEKESVNYLIATVARWKSESLGRLALNFPEH